ncbi:MAG: hypothetical protein RMJ66_04655 [Bacteroidia bacterium]|nr:hypothetical protein [Bacteroidia bacterium]MDW8134337.1 hypothetical protein [Bacteroidia bacterium]
MKAQGTPDILRFIPGRYRENSYHQIDLYNPYPYPLRIGGWLIVTRQYSVRLPLSLTLMPNRRYRLSKEGGDLPLQGYPDFLIRIPEESYTGDYVALLDAEGTFRKGLYLAPIPQVLFLPDSGMNISREGKRTLFYLPAETSPLWEYVSWEPDPITGIVRIEGKWRYTVADAQKEARIYAPVRFSVLLATYEEGAIHLSWEVEGREACKRYFLERWTKQTGWQKIASFPCPSVFPSREKKEYYDPSVLPHATYRYRLVYEGEPSLRLESIPVEIVCRPAQRPLRVEAGAGLIRLWVAQSQPIKVRLLDENFVEQLRVYDGWVNAGVENIFIWDTSRIQGSCWVIVWTPQRRYWRRLCVR